jgi:hypothetical protein
MIPSFLKPKYGILKDYDLWANKEVSAQNQTCALCGAFPMRFQWSDYSYEAMCTQCGCPYQLREGTDEQKKENKYPYLKFNQEFLSVAKTYWQEQGEFVCYGWMLGSQPGMNKLIAWLKICHPEFLKEDS